MHKRSQFRIVCFLLTIMLIVSCFVGCGCTKTDEATSNDTTTEAITVAPTTVAPTTVAPTTAKPTEKPTTAPTTQVIQESNSEVDNDTSEDTNYDSEDTNYEDEEPAENSEDNDTNNNSGNNSTGSGASYSPNEFQNAGIIDWGGWTWTYYSEQILPGEGLDIPGRWTDSDGYVCDGDGYVCLASTSVDRYSVVETPFGRTGKVYDSGCASGTIDIYTNW